MKTDLTQRADLIAAAHGRHVARIAGVRRAIDDEAIYLVNRGATPDPLAPVTLIRETPIEVPFIHDADEDVDAPIPYTPTDDPHATTIAQEIVAAIREGLDVRAFGMRRGDIPFDDWAHERSRNIAQILLGHELFEIRPRK